MLGTAGTALLLLATAALTGRTGSGHDHLAHGKDPAGNRRSICWARTTR